MHGLNLTHITVIPPYLDPTPSDSAQYPNCHNSDPARTFHLTPRLLGDCSESSRVTLIGKHVGNKPSSSQEKQRGAVGCRQIEIERRFGSVCLRWFRRGRLYPSGPSRAEHQGPMRANQGRNPRPRPRFRRCRPSKHPLPTHCLHAAVALGHQTVPTPPNPQPQKRNNPVN